MSGNGQDAQHSSAIAGIRNLVTFQLDRQTFALPIETIVQIVEMVMITPVPQVNHSVEGVINVHGTTVPVINLRRHLGLPEIKLQLHTPIILVQTGERMVGLIVDQMADVLNVSAGQITNPTDILPDGLGDAPLLQGLMHTPKDTVLLIDLNRLFSLDRARLTQALSTLSAADNSSENAKSEAWADPSLDGNEPAQETIRTESVESKA
jgi:purine-binding chemotaxis protein CheW